MGSPSSNIPHATYLNDTLAIKSMLVILLQASIKVIYH